MHGSIVAYVVSSCLVILGVLQAFMGQPIFLSFEIFLLLAMAGFFIGMIYSLLSEHRSRKSNPDEYVTWKAFATILIGIHGEFFSALLLITFNIGRIMGALGI